MPVGCAPNCQETDNRNSSACSEIRIVPPPKAEMAAGGREEPNPFSIQIYKGQRNLPATDQQTARMPQGNARVGLSAGTGFHSSPTLQPAAQLSTRRGRSKK